MTLALDSLTTRRLALARQIYLHADATARNKVHPVSSIMSVIGYDLAIETLLKVVVVSIDPVRKVADGFPSLVDQCDNLLGKNGFSPLPLRSRVLHIHDTRNDAQHSARYPSPSDLDEIRIYAHEFCKQVVVDLWEVDFDHISIVDLISDDLTHQILISARDDLIAGNLKRGLSLVGNAFHWCSKFAFLRSYFTGGYINWQQFPGLDYHARNALARALRAARDDAVDLAATMILIPSIGDFMRYMSIVPFTTFASSYEVTSKETTYTIAIEWNHDPPDADAALWAYDFVVNSIASWQTQGLPATIANQQDAPMWAKLLLDWVETPGPGEAEPGL